MVKNDSKHSGARLLEFETSLHHLLALRPLANYLTVLCLSLYNCKMGIITDLAYSVNQEN